MPEPTAADANLYVQLVAITQSEPHASARRWMQFDFAAESYKEMQERYPPGSDERDRMVIVLGFYEHVGALVSRGLLHEDLVFDAPFHLEVFWPKLRPIIEEWQKATKDPAVWENFQWLGLRYAAWYKERWKPKLELVPPETGAVSSEPHVRGFSR